MSCYHPNVTTCIPGVYQDKWIFRGAGYRVPRSVVPFADDYHEGVNFFEIDNASGHYFLPDVEARIDGAFGEMLPYSVQVPCQQCIGCRLDYSRSWADRIVMEMLSTLGPCWFLTLTYDDDHISDTYVRSSDGSVNSFLYVHEGVQVELTARSVMPDHIQKFLKDLRRYYEYHFDHKGIRFYVSSEYGPKTRRPHYHMCIFNLPIFDLKKECNNKLGDALYSSETLSRIWSKGFVTIGELTWQSAAYVARYVVKKIKGKDSGEFYERHGSVLPEFCRQSNRPGIGAMYFESHYKEIYATDEIFLPSSRQFNGKTKPPRYFDKLLEKLQIDGLADPDVKSLARIKADRTRFSVDVEYNRYIVSGLFDAEYFAIKEKNHNIAIKSLVRSLDN